MITYSVALILLSIVLFDTFGDKTRIYKKSIDSAKDLIIKASKVYDNIPKIDFSKNMTFMASVSKDNNIILSLNGAGSNKNNLYQISLENKQTNENIKAFLQDDTLYYGSDTLLHNIYAYVMDNEDECMGSCPSNIGKYISGVLGSYNTSDLTLNITSINEIADILKSVLSNKYIKKRRIIDTINGKKGLYSKFSYKLNNDSLSDIKTKLVNNEKLSSYVNLFKEYIPNNFDIDSEINIYTSWGQIKEINLILNDKKIIITNNKDKLNISYISNDKKSIISYQNDTLSFEKFTNEEEVLNLSTQDYKNIKVKLNKDGKSYDYSITFNKEITDSKVNGSIMINDANNNYSLNYDMNYNADVKSVVLDNVKNYKEMSGDESKNLNTIFSNLQNNEFTKLLFNLLTMTN